MKKSRRMRRREWEERRRLRRGGDRLAILDNIIYLNDVPLRNVESFRMEERLDFDLQDRPYCRRFVRVTLELVLERGQIVRGQGRYSEGG